MPPGCLCIGTWVCAENLGRATAGYCERRTRESAAGDHDKPVWMDWVRTELLWAAVRPADAETVDCSSTAEEIDAPRPADLLDLG